ncbi:hypothetical protein Pan110_00020 [Gimesia panareensis]|nr:hypothetical protein Pan110_00020 [Gimesia panareensis]
MTDRKFTESSTVSQRILSRILPMSGGHFVDNLLISGREMWSVFQVLNAPENGFHRPPSLSSSSPLCLRILLTSYRQKTPPPQQIQHIY